MGRAPSGAPPRPERLCCLPPLLFELPSNCRLGPLLAGLLTRDNCRLRLPPNLLGFLPLLIILDRPGVVVLAEVIVCALRGLFLARRLLRLILCGNDFARSALLLLVPLAPAPQGTSTSLLGKGRKVLLGCEVERGVPASALVRLKRAGLAGAVAGLGLVPHADQHGGHVPEHSPFAGGRPFLGGAGEILDPRILERGPCPPVVPLEGHPSLWGGICAG
mmetsp:Transcript_67117/g.212407  ORF Transcript_67117/g.212407 Transcript_67117/m.212407 type:complete len:219 (-) Transcript_67117:289-945(-)